MSTMPSYAVDDPFLFSHGDLVSVRCLVSALKYLENVSRLHINETKSSIFCCSMQRGLKDKILQFLGYREEDYHRNQLLDSGAPFLCRKSSTDQLCVEKQADVLKTTIVKDLWRDERWRLPDPTDQLAVQAYSYSLTALFPEDITVDIGFSSTVALPLFSAFTIDLNASFSILLIAR
ncbi:hypothetical protein V6N13_097946 [Hibiscus sabdariffa]|uniref:Uncharacterized protein n=1 Tax=Hibiscus sabdariffa TaxID=183260 RepID=A0ABR2NVQ5_9ROSI